MYPPGTILVLKERPKDYTGPEPFPYDRVEVVSASPIVHRVSGYVGPDATGIVIRPIAGFDATIDEPYGKLKELYSVESMPEETVPRVTVEQVNRTRFAPTPEEIFAEEAAARGERRQSRKREGSKLPDPPKKPSSPLG